MIGKSAKSSRGFSLVELLVVVSIVTILSVIGVLIYNGVTQNARESKKKADIDALSKAYEAAFSGGAYRDITGADFVSGSIPGESDGSSYYRARTADSSSFRVCVALKNNPTPTCNTPSATCYCKDSIHNPFAGAVATPAPGAEDPTPVPTSAPTPATYVSDSFNRANLSTLGNTDTGQPWIITSGSSFGISSNQAYPVNGCPAPGYAVVDSGRSDATIQITLPTNPQDVRIPFRYVDSSNMYWIERPGGAPAFYTLNRLVGGSRIVIGTSSIGAADGDTLRIYLSGSNIRLFVNGVQSMNITDSSLNGTRHGIGLWCTGAVRYDNFSVSENVPIPTPAPTPAPTPGDTNTSYNYNVLVLSYFPLTANRQNIDINVTGDVGDPYSVIRQRARDETNNLKSYVENGSRYLGYSNPSAQPALNLTIFNSIEYETAVPIQTGSTNMPDLNRIMNDHNICDLVDNQNVREVWIWAYQGPGPKLAISESQITGPVYRRANGPYYSVPICSKTYWIYTLNYGASGYAYESWGHQMEWELSTVDGNLFSIWQGPYAPQARGVIARCGSVHDPPNARGAYDWSNPNPHQSDCLNWNPDGLGTLTQISCFTWNPACPANQDGGPSTNLYKVWNWQNLPGRENTKTYQGRYLRNWWDIHGDFDNVMATNRRLTF